MRLLREFPPERPSVRVTLAAISRALDAETAPYHGLGFPRAVFASSDGPTEAVLVTELKELARQLAVAFN